MITKLRPSKPLDQALCKKDDGESPTKEEKINSLLYSVLLVLKWPKGTSIDMVNNSCVPLYSKISI